MFFFSSLPYSVIPQSHFENKSKPKKYNGKMTDVEKNIRCQKKTDFSKNNFFVEFVGATATYVGRVLSGPKRMRTEPAKKTIRTNFIFFKKVTGIFFFAIFNQKMGKLITHR